MFDYLSDLSYSSGVCNSFDAIKIQDLNVFKEKVYGHFSLRNEDVKKNMATDVIYKPLKSYLKETVLTPFFPFSPFCYSSEPHLYNKPYFTNCAYDSYIMIKKSGLSEFKQKLNNILHTIKILPLVLDAPHGLCEEKYDILYEVERDNVELLRDDFNDHLDEHDCFSKLLEITNIALYRLDLISDYQCYEGRRNEIVTIIADMKRSAQYEDMD